MTIASAFPTVQDLGDSIGPRIKQQWDTFCRAFLVSPACQQCDEYVRIITGEPHPFGNFAVVADANNPDHAAAAIEPLCAIDQPSALIFSHAPSDQVQRVITDAGFVLGETMPAMAVSIDELTPTELPSGYEFREFTAEEDDAWCAAFATGYGIPRISADHFGPAAAAHLTESIEPHYYAVMKGDEIVGTSAVLIEGGLAGIYCVATLPDHRGKGLGAHATAEPLRLMQNRGCRTGILQSSEMGEPVYRRIGFNDHGSLMLYVRMPEGSGIGGEH